ncbi:hypothetical protein ACFGVS_21620 [Mucilaginibacter sp. AW1-7]|uniref:hypothetical protein n=1 Tax=Mucilaginibacter sp. AW1-7 TaxID=3349874 RepID=UPI003F7414CF
MSKQNQRFDTSVGFEVLDARDHSIVYKRVIPTKGRTAKENTQIELSLPKATLYCFDSDDFNKLKIIEKQIVEKMEVSKPSKSLYSKLFGFLDI